MDATLERYGLNGIQPKRTRAKVRKATVRRTPRVCRYAAAAVGSVGVGLLGVSLSHCTEAIGLLTGSGSVLSGAMAFGIDAGFVACELAALASHGTDAGRAVKPWTTAYIVATVLLSCLLNAYAFGLHAADGMQWASWLLGIVLPPLVYVLGRVAGSLWLATSR